MIVNSRKEAWKKADAIFTTDYMKDDIRSERAGYDVYYSTADGVNAWISDLNDRLEINLDSGETINIWIVDEPEYKEYQIADALEVISEAIYKIDDEVDYKLAEVTGIEKARKQLYGAYAKIAKILKRDYPESELYKKYNLAEA